MKICLYLPRLSADTNGMDIIKGPEELTALDASGSSGMTGSVPACLAEANDSTCPGKGDFLWN